MSEPLSDEVRARMRGIADLIEERDAFAYNCWVGLRSADGAVRFVERTYDDYGQCIVDYTASELLAGEMLGCQMVGCIGGWTAAYALEKGDVDESNVSGPSSISEFAQGYLDLDYYQARALFHGGIMVGLGWYADEAAALNEATAMEAVKVLRGLADGEWELSEFTEE